MTVLGSFGHRLVATGVVNLARLKWFAIVPPLAALRVLVILLRSSLHDWLLNLRGHLPGRCLRCGLRLRIAVAVSGYRRVLRWNGTLSELSAGLRLDPGAM